jgi:CheB methylesterase
VIVVSTSTRRHAEISVKCLSLGAVDYLAKPDSQRERSTSEDFRRDLIEKLKAHAGSRVRAVRLAPTAPRAAAKPILSRPKCLLIGASTGGPRAIEQVLIGLGARIQRIPVLIVQHMPPIFTTVFAVCAPNSACGHPSLKMARPSCPARSSSPRAGGKWVSPAVRGNLSSAWMMALPRVSADRLSMFSFAMQSQFSEAQLSR